MPVRQYEQRRPSGYHDLVDELFSEWSNPNQNASEPLILEEKDRDNRIIHIYVVWAKWTHIDRVQRGEIIMDAAERKLPPGSLTDITIAMGLTPQEARNMGIVE